jgi:hypothetical protein
MKVAEPEPGRILTESDTGSSLVTKTTVAPQGSMSLVPIAATWDGAGGIGGFFERLFAPRVMPAFMRMSWNGSTPTPVHRDT